MNRVASIILVLLGTLIAISVQAAAIEFTSGSKIQGAAAMLVFKGYGTTYAKTTSKYTATDENGNKFTVQDAAGSYLLVNIGYAPSSKQRTTIILTYENGDTGTASFEGGTFHPGAFLEVKTTTGRNNYCEDTYATLIASGATAEKLTWQTSKDNATWSEVEGQTGLTADVLAPRGTTYYRFKQSATEISSSIAIVGQVCCTTVDEQDVVWRETFDDAPFPYPNVTRNQCKWVKGYKFKSEGKVDDGYYVVVACSSAASPAQCSWPSGKYDHTSGNGKSGFLIINAGADKKVMYQQTIKSDRGFCNGVYYNLSLYATNITAAGNAPARFSFDIVQIMNDGTEVEIVKDYDSGEIEGSSMENWYNYGVAFAPQNVENIGSLVVRLWNTGGEVQGNDVVLDDISVSVCNARVELFADYPEYDLTTDCGESVKIQAIEDGNLTTHFGRPDPYYLWMKSVDGGLTWDSIPAASGFGMKEYTTVTKKGEQAIFKTIVATDGKAAQKAFDGTASGSCVIYTVTNESKVQCEGCVAPSVPQTEDQKVCVGATGVEYKATASSGCTLLWYESIDATVPLAVKPTVDTSVAGEQSTYVSQKNEDDCESQRVKVKVSVRQTALEPVVSDYEECATATEGTFDLSDRVTANKDYLTWYTTSTGTEKLTSTTIYTNKVQDKTYYVSNSYEGAKCESDRTSLTVKVNEIPSTPVPDKPKYTYCEGSAIPAMKVVYSGDMTNISIRWYDSESATAHIAEGTEYTATTDGKYYVEALNTVTGCKSDRVSIELAKYDNPDASITKSHVLLTCDTVSITLKALPESGVTYLWSDQSTGSTLDVSAKGTYSVRVTDSATQCWSDATVTIDSDTSTPVVKVVSEGGKLVLDCYTSSIKLTANVTAFPDVSYTWSNGDTTQQVTAIAAGIYNIEVKHKSSGCTSTDGVTITDIRTYPAITVVDDVMRACHPDVIDLKSAVTSHNCEMLKFYSDSALQNELSETEITNPGSATYYVQGSNSDGCKSDPKSVAVAINELSVRSMSDTAVCAGETVVLWAKGNGVQAQQYCYKFTSDGKEVGETVTGSEIVLRIVPDKSAEYMLTATNGVCEQKRDADVIIYPLPETDYLRTDTLEFDVIQLSEGAEPYKYSLNGGAAQDTTHFSVPDFGVYRVVTTDVKGCKSSMDVNIEKIVLPIEIPPYFTPNGDGVNDVWYITNIDSYPNAIIYIYDRYHKILTRLHGTDDGWDGNYNGHPMPMTDYWYLILDEQLGTLSGHFILKR